MTIDEQGRVEPPEHADEWETLTGFLDYQRQTFGWKTAGLDADQLRATVGVSTMTLGGMMKHLAYVEHDWFERDLLDLPRAEPWASVDWEADRDWEWHTARDDDPAELRELWTTSIDRARAAALRAYEDGGLGRIADRTLGDGFRPSLRWIITHMIEEYARHNGHADLLRESIDGQTGE